MGGLDFTDPEFTSGIDFSEKIIPIKAKKIKMQIWDVSGTAIDLIPPTADNASAILLVYDLNLPFTLRRIEEYHKESLKCNSKNFFLVGCKYDMFIKQNKEFIRRMTQLSIRVSNKFKKPLIFCSSKKSINIKKLFKVVICQYFGVDSRLEERTTPGEPVLIYRKYLKRLRRQSSKNKETNNKNKEPDNKNNKEPNKNNKEPNNKNKEPNKNNKEPIKNNKEPNKNNKEPIKNNDDDKSQKRDKNNNKKEFKIVFHNVDAEETNRVLEKMKKEKIKKMELERKNCRVDADDEENKENKNDNYEPTPIVSRKVSLKRENYPHLDDYEFCRMIAQKEES